MDDASLAYSFPLVAGVSGREGAGRGLASLLLNPAWPATPQPANSVGQRPLDRVDDQDINGDPP